MGSALEKYRKLEQQLLNLRKQPDRTGEDEEAILDAMNPVWESMTESERQEIAGLEWHDEFWRREARLMRHQAKRKAFRATMIDAFINGSAEGEND